MRGGRWAEVAVVVAAVVVTVTMTYLLSAWPPEPPNSSLPAVPGDSAAPSGSGATDEPTDAVTDVDTEPPVVVMVGDSFSSGPPDAGALWPDLLGDELGWSVETLAAPDTGYVASGSGDTFAGRVDEVAALQPDVVLVAGGFSDVLYNREAVARAANRFLGRLASEVPEARIVLLSPFSNGEPGPRTTALSEELQSVAEKHAVAYLEVTSYLPYGEGLLADDGVLPSDEGHARIASRLADELDDLGLVPTA